MCNGCSIMLLACFAVFATASYANSEDAKVGDDTEKLSHGTIFVHLKGNLGVATGLRDRANPDSRPQDENAWKLTNAWVNAGGGEIQLDWSRSSKIHDELLWWRVLRHGDLRQVQAEVTGQMTFRPAGEIDGVRTISAGVSKATPVPVVVVETLKVQLVGAGGKPRGHQYDRGRVTAD